MTHSPYTGVPTSRLPLTPSAITASLPAHVRRRGRAGSGAQVEAETGSTVLWELGLRGEADQAPGIPWGVGVPFQSVKLQHH